MVKLMDRIDYTVDESVQIRVLLAQLVDLLHRMQHRRVMLAAEHRPISGREDWVSSLIRYIAICRG